MATAILSTTITPEALDERYPAPSWATEEKGGQGKNTRWGWGQTYSGTYSRILSWIHRHVVVSVVEVCDQKGDLMAVFDPDVDFLEGVDLAGESEESDARQVITEVTEDLQSAWLRMLEIEYYVNQMQEQCGGATAPTTPEGSDLA